MFKRIHERLRETLRQQAGREAEPSIGILDSQSVKTTNRGGEAGFDAGKKVFGRKRHLVVDTSGFVIAAVVHGANIQDRDGGKFVLAKASFEVSRLKAIRADGTYAGQFKTWVKGCCG